MIQDIIIYDLFDKGARDREVEEYQKASHTTYHELAVSRSLESWQLVSSIIPFLPNQASFYVCLR